MTTTSIFQKHEKSKKKKKPIEFINYIKEDASFRDDCDPPHVWDNIMLLLTTGKKGEVDIMYAWDDKKPTDGCIYRGYWNDGVVEK